MSKGELISYATKWKQYAEKLEEGTSNLADAGAAIVKGFQELVIYLHMTTEDAQREVLKTKADCMEWEAIARELLEEKNAG